MAEQTDAERVADALPSVERMAEADGADLTTTGGESRCDHPHHATASTNGENLCINGDSWHCKRHRHGAGKLAWAGMSEGVIDCGDLNDGSIPSSLFRDVLEVAADRAGVDLSDAPAVPEKVREKREEFDADRLAVAQYYHDLLDAHGMRAELKQRYGFSDDLIDSNLIGYAPEAGMDHDLPDGSGVSRERLKRLGLLSSGGAPHFRDRFVFPYWVSERGGRHVRYFTARAVDHDGGPKYLKIAKSGDVDEQAQHEPPFGIDTVRGSRTVVLTEGVTDALTLHDHGIAAVSPVTTHISGDALEQFADALRGKNVYVVYDEDAGTQAGIQGAASDAHALKTEHVDARVARLPAQPNESIDVNEWFRQYDGEGAADAFRDEVLGGVTYPASVARWAWSGGQPADVFSAAVEEIGEDPAYFIERENDDGDRYYVSVQEALDGIDNIADARRRFYHSGDTNLSAKLIQEAYFHVVKWVFSVRGEFFRTESGDVLYYHERTNSVVQVTREADPSTVDSEFLHTVERTLGISTSDWARGMFEAVARWAAFNTPTRPVARLSHRDDERGELYINKFDGHYYALDGQNVELRRNGTDVFFRSQVDAEPYQYRPESERDALPERVPGERPPFVGTGDLLHRLVCNRINYDEQANLGPTEQRTQLYLHLHAIAFGSDFDSRPIMAWVGEKGSGKTMALRAIGQFIYGDEWRESVMPDEKDDFMSKVSNQTLAAIDNYDDGVEWANDALAALATGASVEKRELYTTNDMRKVQPDCFLALTSRDPPFRRDDVADRCLVFRVERVSGDFISETQYLSQIRIYRDELWSQYLDNLNAILAKRQADADPHRTTTHRMADWALFAQDAAGALEVSNCDRLLEGMETERAFFALENEPLRVIIEQFLRDNPDGGSFEAGDLLGDFESAANEAGITMPYNTSRGLSNALTSLSEELGELFGMEVRESRSGPKRYDFPGAGRQGMLGYDFDRGGDDAE